MSSLRSSPPPMVPPPPPAGENTQMVDIEQPHKHDVLCGRGVTTNRFPGNESFRSLVSLNKELYVTSTKRQKMSISRSIVEAVRSLKPPGRFLEKNPVTGLWSDIGDRKAIEKTSQALRDGAAGLRKELSEDLGDPDFLSGLFDVDKTSAKSKPTSPSGKTKEKPVKAKPTKKGHRRTRSNPSSGGAKPAAKILQKQKSQGAEAEPSPESAATRSSNLPPRPMSPTSPRSQVVVSPTGGGWSMRLPPGSRPHRGAHYPPPPPPEGAMPYKASRPYHRSHSYHMTPQHHGPPRPPPHHPHSWSHAPPRYPGPTSPPTVVHTPNSPLPPGRHQLTPNGCISKPPLSPVVPPPRWSPRHFSRHPSYPPPPPPEYGRHDYPPPPPPPPGHPHDYGRPPPGHPDFWPPHPRHHHGRHPSAYRDHYADYYHDYPHEGLDVPALGREHDHHYHHRSYRSSREHHPSEAPQTPPQEFSPPVTPSRRRKPEKPSSSASSPASSNGMSQQRSPAHEVAKSGGDRMSDASEGTRSSAVVICDKNRVTKDDATQKTMMSPLSEADGVADVDMAECRAEEREEPPPRRKDVHIISVVHQLDDTTGEGEEGIEFMLKDPAADEYNFSPLPFEREDPTTLLELPDDILQRELYD